MKRAILLSVLAGIAASGAVAQAWHTQDAAQITQALTDRSLRYANGATQQFYASGRTLYTHGEPSWGEWSVRDDQYCSIWPPARDWECYDLQADGIGGFNFIDARSNPFFGVYDE